MKFVKGIAAAVAATVMAAQPVVASEAVQKLSLKNVAGTNVRVASKAGKSKALEGTALLLVIGGVVAAAVVVAVVADGNSDSP